MLESFIKTYRISLKTFYKYVDCLVKYIPLGENNLSCLLQYIPY